MDELSFLVLIFLLQIGHLRDLGFYSPIIFQDPGKVDGWRDEKDYEKNQQKIGESELFDPVGTFRNQDYGELFEGQCNLEIRFGVDENLAIDKSKSEGSKTLLQSFLSACLYQNFSAARCS